MDEQARKRYDQGDCHEANRLRQTSQRRMGIIRHSLTPKVKSVT